MIRGLLIGSIAAVGLAAATSASAQGIYFGGPGISVDIGPRPYYEPRPYYGPPRAYYHADGPYASRCRTVWRETPYGMQRVTRCWR